MKRRVLWLVPLLAWAAAPWALAGAEDKPPPDKAATPADQYQALTKEYQSAQQDFFKEYQAAKTPEAKQKVFAAKYPNAQKYAQRFLDLAEKHPKDPAAVDA